MSGSRAKASPRDALNEEEVQPLTVEVHTSEDNTADDNESTTSADSHQEPHFAGAEIVRDIIIGLSDGLTVPFALAAGLASLDNSRLVVTAGIAEIVAGSISMGLGGYLAGMSEIEHYDSERRREVYEVETVPEREAREIEEIFEPFGVQRDAVQPIISHLKKDKKLWVDFMMKFELNLEKPDKNRTWISALTIGFSYFAGGLVPLVPYMLVSAAKIALLWSVGVTVLALFVFGYVKAWIVGQSRPLVSATQMAFIGSAAAGAAYGIAMLLPQETR